MKLVPVTLKVARRFADIVHSHHDRPQGALFAAGVEADGALVCVAIFGNPSAPALQGVAGEVTRVGSDGSTPHAASKAIAAVSRAAVALGWRRLVSYTLLGEAGTCYRAAGWHCAGIVAADDSAHGSRKSAPAHPGRKARWEFGPDAMPLDVEADAVVRAAVGVAAVPPRRFREPLFRGMATGRAGGEG